MRKINRSEVNEVINNRYPYGLNTITNLKTDIVDEYINVTVFKCEREDNVATNETHDIRSGQFKVYKNHTVDHNSPFNMMGNEQ
jgi:hypothetical protein